MSYEYERAMGTENSTPNNAADAAGAIMRIGLAVAEREEAQEAAERREEEYRAYVSQMTDAQLIEEYGVLDREKWVAKCNDSRFERSGDFFVVQEEYFDRRALRSMPETPLPTGVPCFDEWHAERQSKQTLEETLPGNLLFPIRTYALTARAVVHPETSVGVPMLGQNPLITAIFLAGPLAVGYWTYKKKDDSLLWGGGAALGTLYGMTTVVSLLPFLAIAGVRY